jgi:hypothetical protein
MRAALVLAVLAAVAAGQELIRNPGFAENAAGWKLRQATAVEGGLRLDGDERSSAFAGVSVEPVHGREHDFRCRAKGSRGGKVLSVNAFAYGEGDALLGSRTTVHELRPDDWVEARETFVVPPETKRLALWIINASGAPVVVTDAHLVVGKENGRTNMAGGSLGGPGVIRASAGTTAKAAKEGTEGVVTFPVPALTRDQVPLTFTVVAEPAAALRSFRWRLREDGRNRLCDVTLQASPAGVSVRWEALVLVGGRADAPLPAAAAAEAPEEAAAWLRATACVQSGDPAIVGKAKELAEGADGVEGYVRRVIAFTSQNRGRPGVAFDALDARKALDCGGSCTSRANLCAALLRAHGIPARTQAHLPTWSGPLYEHWLVEYWHPGAGWTWVEPTLNRVRPEPWTLVVLNVAYPEDEELAFDLRIAHSGVVPGVPLWSVHNIAWPLDRSFGKATDNLAAPETRLRGTADEIAAALDAAQAAFEQLAAGAERGRTDLARDERIARALKVGTAAALRDALGTP